MEIVIEDDYLVNLVSSYPNTEGKRKFPLGVEKKFVQRVGQLRAVSTENDLRAIGSFHFEKLYGEYNGKYSIRVNRSWRIIFRLDKEGCLKILFIEELNNHYDD
ncbi:type II toxin-antitoxin system RelE/ParE family toxin [Sphingobacterium lactis]|uniref:type II toxin-antitoxin system RelE/ParE family toxin n=1 Tax=Sphingobacterium lactis TaxID=797291 RepID=UPI003F7CECBF